MKGDVFPRDDHKASHGRMAYARAPKSSQVRVSSRPCRRAAPSVRVVQSAISDLGVDGHSGIGDVDKTPCTAVPERVGPGARDLYARLAQIGLGATGYHRVCDRQTRPITSCDASSRPFFGWPRLRRRGYSCLPNLMATKLGVHRRDCGSLLLAPAEWPRLLRAHGLSFVRAYARLADSLGIFRPARPGGAHEIQRGGA
jgi:hypothetical protein